MRFLESNTQTERTTLLNRMKDDLDQLQRDLRGGFGAASNTMSRRDVQALINQAVLSIGSTSGAQTWDDTLRKNQRASRDAILYQGDAGKSTPKLTWKNQGASKQWDLYMNASGDLLFDDEAGNKLAFMDDGKVGIGTNAPTCLLNIYANDATAYQYEISQDSTGDAAIRYRLVGEYAWIVGIDNTDNFFKIGTGSALGANNNLVLDGNNVKVGINTAEIAGRLHVRGGDSGFSSWNFRISSGIVLEQSGSTDAIFAFMGGTTSNQEFWFGDTDNQNRGRVRYEHTDDIMELWTGSVPILWLSLSQGGAVINEDGRSDIDTRIEGDTFTHLLFTDASADRIGFNNSAPAYFIEAIVPAGGEVRLNENDDTLGWRYVENVSDTHAQGIQHDSVYTVMLTAEDDTQFSVPHESDSDGGHVIGHGAWDPLDATTNKDGFVFAGTGSIVGLAVKFNHNGYIIGSATAGKFIQFDVAINGTKIGLQITHDVATTGTAIIPTPVTQAKGLDTYSAGDYLQVIVSHDDGITETIDLDKPVATVWCIEDTIVN